jgi:hypothetical protein
VWSLSELTRHWEVFVLAQQQVVELHGRCVLLGEHTYIPMSANKAAVCPGVVTIHQESETQSKPSYFRGQWWGLCSHPFVCF